MSGGSAFDPIQYFEQYPTLKYTFAALVMAWTLLGIIKNARKVLSGEDRPPEKPALQAEQPYSRVEQKLDQLTWNMSEVRRDVHELLDVVRPGPRREMRHFNPDNGGSS